MAADTAHWLELTEFARCEPSALAFRALAALLDTWPGDDQAAAIAYADNLLSTWPDAVRLAPWSWCKAAATGAVPPTWPLVRALQLRSSHLTKGTVDLARVAHHASLEQITALQVPFYSTFQELSFLYHRPEAFRALKTLHAADKYDDGEVRALAASPLWRTLEAFEIGDLTDSLLHNDASRIVPQLDRLAPVRHLMLRSLDLVAIWAVSGGLHSLGRGSAGVGRSPRAVPAELAVDGVPLRLQRQRAVRAVPRQRHRSRRRGCRRFLPSCPTGPTGDARAHRLPGGILGTRRPGARWTACPDRLRPAAAPEAPAAATAPPRRRGCRFPRPGTRKAAGNPRAGRHLLQGRRRRRPDRFALPVVLAASGPVRQSDRRGAFCPDGECPDAAPAMPRPQRPARQCLLHERRPATFAG